MAVCRQHLSAYELLVSNATPEKELSLYDQRIKGCGANTIYSRVPNNRERVEIIWGMEHFWKTNK